jgi:chromosome segregation ATPase
MVVIRRPANSEEKQFEDYQQAFAKIQEYVAFITRTVERKTAMLSDLNSQIEVLTKKKDSLEGSLQAKEDEWKSSHEKKAQDLIAMATGEARKKVDALTASAKTEVENLTLKKAELEKSIKQLSESHAERSQKLKERIQMLEVDEASLKDEVAKLTNARDELRKQISSIKETFASLT